MICWKRDFPSPQCLRENIVARGLQPAEVRIDGIRVKVRFSDVAEGLEVRGEHIEGFALSTADGFFHPAIARLADDTVFVSSDSVPVPVFVRYGFRGVPLLPLLELGGVGCGAPPKRRFCT